MYLEWLCTYWIKAATTRKDRHKLLPLVVLELSSVYEEDEEELMEELENANAILEGADKDRDETGVSRVQGDSMSDGANTNRDQRDSMSDGTYASRDQRDSMSGGSDDSLDKGAPMSGDTNASRSQTESEPYDTNPHAVRFSKMLPEKALACLRLDDTYLNQA